MRILPVFDIGMVFTPFLDAHITWVTSVWCLHHSLMRILPVFDFGMVLAPLLAAYVTCV